MGTGVGVGVVMGAGLGVTELEVLPEPELSPPVVPEPGPTTTICGSMVVGVSGSSAASLLVSQKHMSATASKKNTINKTAANLPFFMLSSVLSYRLKIIIPQKPALVYNERNGAKIL